MSVNQHQPIAQFVDVVACPGQNGGEPRTGAGDRCTEGGRGAAPPKLGCQFAAQFIEGWLPQLFEDRLIGDDGRHAFVERYVERNP